MGEEILIKDINDYTDIDEKVVELYYLSDIYKIAEILKKPVLKMKGIEYYVYSVIDGKIRYVKLEKIKNKKR